MTSIHACFFDVTPTTEIYTLSLHDALPIWRPGRVGCGRPTAWLRCPAVDPLDDAGARPPVLAVDIGGTKLAAAVRSEEHTSELQSLAYLVCRLLLEKKKKHIICSHHKKKID